MSSSSTKKEESKEPTLSLEDLKFLPRNKLGSELDTSVVLFRDNPQYALDYGKPKHVDYLLFSEFDIDKGSLLRYQYPEPTGADEQELAELMLPDGAHNRENDWTTFILNRDSESEAAEMIKEFEKQREAMEEDTTGKKPRQELVEAFVYQCIDSKKGWELLSDERKFIFFHPNTLYICNKDKTDFKVIERHDKLQYTILESQFSCVFDEKGAAIGLRFLTEEDELRFQQMVETFGDPEASEERWGALEDRVKLVPAKPMLYGLNLVKTKLDSSVRRGARVKAMAVCTRSQYYHIFKPLLILGLNKFFDRDDIGILEELYESINAMDLSEFPEHSLTRKIAYRTTDTAPDDFVAHIRYTGAKLSVKVPQTMLPDEVGDGSVIELQKLFKEQIMTIYDALLKQKRVLFLGYSRAAQEVVTYTISCIYTVVPALRGFMKRCFPYANLVMLDFLSTPGYIAGVTNSIFEEHKEWWDVLCDINTGKVVLAENVSKEVPLKDQQPVPIKDLDMEFYRKVEASINSVNNPADEKRIRSMFKDYTQMMVDIAFDDYVHINRGREVKESKLQEELQDRINYFRMTDMYTNYELDRENRQITSSLKASNLGEHIQQLRHNHDLSPQFLRQAYSDFLQHVRTEDEIIEFLGFLPESQGGLYPIALGLFCQDDTLRDSTVTLLRRIDTIQMGTVAINKMNFFLVLAYDRFVREMIENNQEEQEEIEEEEEQPQGDMIAVEVVEKEEVKREKQIRREQKEKMSAGINGARSLFKRRGSDDLMATVMTRRMTIEKSYKKEDEEGSSSNSS